MLALLKYPFYYTIRRGFGNFFGMIHVLTRHLAPELDRFRFCPGFWSMLYFGRKLDIFGDVSTHGHNWAKMRNKEKNPHTKDPFELDTRERRHRRPHRPSAPLQVGGQQGIHPLPEISSPWSTTLRLASWGKVLVCSWGCKEILSCNCRILYEIDLSRFLLMMLWCLIVRDLALGLLCSCMVYLDYINYRVLVDSLPIILV
jgi:hypothetical protein